MWKVEAERLAYLGKAVHLAVLCPNCYLSMRLVSSPLNVNSAFGGVCKCADIQLSTREEQLAALFYDNTDYYGKYPSKKQLKTMERRD